jgi:alcohol dehydrogenase
MNDSWNFHLATRVVHGRGAARGLGQVAADVGIRRALLVTDAGVAKAGVLDQVLGPLRSSGIETVVFDEVEANPTLRTVDRGAARFAASRCDGVVAVGGGSPMDAGKAIGVLSTNPGPVASHLAPRTIANPGLPVICVPTTAGTGAEVTCVAGLRDGEIGSKVALAGPLVAARVAVLDPLLTLSLPPGPTRDSGLDVLTHAIESYINVTAWDGTRVLALRAIEMVAQHLRTAVHRGSDLEARDGMLTASLLAGMAFANTDLGLVHAIALTVGGPFNTPHGATNAVLLPHAMRFLLPAALPQFAEIAVALGQKTDGRSTAEMAETAVQTVECLCADTGLPRGLSALGVEAESLPELAAAMARHPMTPFSPRRATPNDCLEICRKAL